MNSINPKNWKFPFDFVGYGLGIVAVLVIMFAIFVPTSQGGYIVTDANGNEECVLEVNVGDNVNLAALGTCEDEFAAWSSSAALGAAMIGLIAVLGVVVFAIASAGEVNTRAWLILGALVVTAVTSIWAANTLFEGDFIASFFWRGVIAALAACGTVWATTAFYQKNPNRT